MLSIMFLIRGSVLALHILALATQAIALSIPVLSKHNAKEDDISFGLRGGVYSPIVALQTSSELHEAKLRTNTSRSSHRQKHASNNDLAVCRKRRLIWWITIRKKCQKAFGKGSKWDKSRKEGMCRKAWSSCRTFYYSLCCTQPSGPKTMEAYCDKCDAENDALGKKATQDKACKVEGLMKGVKKEMAAIVSQVKLMDVATSSPSANASPAAAPLQRIMMSSPSPGPAPAVEEPALTVPMTRRCEELTALAKRAVKKLNRVRTWAVEDGFDGKRTGVGVKKLSEAKDDPKASDPDLAMSLKSVMKLGTKLHTILDGNDLCTPTSKVDHDNDKDETDSASQNEEENALEGKQSGQIGTKEMKPNLFAINEFLEIDGEMNQAIDNFETQVHPHGTKWWRYRFEYTILESVVFAISVVVLYLLKLFIFGLSYFQEHRFYKTGRTQNIYRYSFLYVILQAACVWLVVAFAYLLYIPWGEKNVLNLCATAFHSFVDGAFNVPYMGYSWLYLVLDIQIQLFATYCLYAVFLYFVSRNYIAALEDWKAIDISTSMDGGLQSKSAANEFLYTRFAEVIRLRVENTPSLKASFRKPPVRLRMDGVSGLDKKTQGDGGGSCDFKLHLYLTEGLGKSMEFLVDVSLVTNLWLAATALVVAFFAYMYQLAFMYLLPPFVLLGILILVSGYALSKHFLSLSEDLDHDAEATCVTVHNFCRTVQIVLYCIFYGFARLLISADIFVNYPLVYLSALVTLILILFSLAVFGGQIMKETTCALMLPPHISNDRFARTLKAIMEWHEIMNCHECGSAQHREQEAYSIHWAGMPGAATAPPKFSSPRKMLSW